MKKALVGLAVLTANMAMSTFAYNPPQDVRNGVTARILDFDERAEGRGLAVVERDATRPFEVRVALKNEGVASVKGPFRAWLNDDWEVAGAPNEATLAAGESKTLSFLAHPKPGRVLEALYPVHATFADVHPIAVFRAKPGERPAPKEGTGPFALAGTGGVRLDNLPFTGWFATNGVTRPLAGSTTRATFQRGCMGIQQGSRHGFVCHPPWWGCTGVVWADFDLSLPVARPLKLTFSTALSEHDPLREKPSDGTEHKVIVVADGETTELCSFMAKSGVWRDGEVDLSRWSGRRVTLRLWVGPGPRMDTNCDSCGWGDPILLAGTPPAASSEAEWAARERRAVAAARAAREGKSATLAFRLAGRGETFGAAWEPGRQGLFDGVLAFSDGSRDLTYRGFACDVDGDRAGTDFAPCLRVETKPTPDGGVEIVHELGGLLRVQPVPLRVTIRADRGALRLGWDMPGVVRDVRGHPRYTSLGLGAGSQPVWRSYSGFGNVIVNPVRFSFPGGGFHLSTRHAGGDYANGLSLVQATDIDPDALVCDRGRRVYALTAHHDAAFTFVPSAKGAFAAARHYRDLCGFKRSPGYATALGRMCIDQWNGDYDRAASDLLRAGKYGLAESFFVKHDWQCWGYDYRLPEIWPPFGSLAAFRRMREACARTGIHFLPHDNYIDFYPDAAGFSYDDVLFNRDGTPQRAWFNEGRRALSYRWAPNAFLPHLEANAKRLREEDAADGVFIDVFASIQPMDFYDRAGRFYPGTLTRAAWGAAFDRFREELGRSTGITVSECGTDALVGHLDAAQSDHMPARRWMDPALYEDAERTPWHDMASHGSFILLSGGLGHRYAAYNWDQDGNARLHGYGSDDYLGNGLLGGRAPMCDGPCYRRTVMTYWLLHDICAALARADFEALDFAEENIHRPHTLFSNGGEVWVNRATNATWTVAGEMLPPYGFLAKAPGLCVGVTLRDGGRGGFARADGRLFVDARPLNREACGQPAASWPTGAMVEGTTRCRIVTAWDLEEPVRDFVPFVHIVPENDNARIVFQGDMDLTPEKLNAAGRFTATIDVRIPANLPAGRYDVRYGAYRVADGVRLGLRGLDDRSCRLRGGTLVVERSDEGVSRVAWETSGMPELDEPLNRERKTLPFGEVRTDGAFRLDYAAGAERWRLTPLPMSDPFRAELDLATLGARGRRVVRIDGVESGRGAQNAGWKQEGDRLEITLDAKSFAYDIVFGP